MAARQPIIDLHQDGALQAHRATGTPQNRIIVVQAFKALLEPGRPTALPRTHYWQIFVISRPATCRAEGTDGSGREIFSSGVGGPELNREHRGAPDMEVSICRPE